jgi:hypothetical protein
MREYGQFIPRKVVEDDAKIIFFHPKNDGNYILKLEIL